MQNLNREMGGFKKFLLRGNVVDLAVGLVVGAAFGSVVQALVRDFLNPLIGLLGGSGNLAEIVFTVRNSHFLVGDFLGVMLNFLLVAVLVYYLVVVPVNRLRDRFESQPPPPAPTRECPECLSKVPARARRCPQCTSVLTPEDLY
ncbi:MAG: large conductance mechanosensitive channel protein [Chloroflexi bacterium]|nr:large conductance mechanosensitive channel protein [Chloroflexota bacterium]